MNFVLIPKKLTKRTFTFAHNLQILTSAKYFDKSLLHPKNLFVIPDITFLTDFPKNRRRQAPGAILSRQDILAFFSDFSNLRFHPKKRNCLVFCLDELPRGQGLQVQRKQNWIQWVSLCFIDRPVARIIKELWRIIIVLTYYSAEIVSNTTL